MVIGTNPVSDDKDGEWETRPSKARFRRLPDDFRDFSEPRAEATSGACALSSVKLFFRKRLVSPERMLNVLPSFSVNEEVREGEVGRDVGDPTGDSISVSGDGERNGIVNRLRPPNRGDGDGLVLGLGLGDKSLTLGRSTEKSDGASWSRTLGNSICTSYSSLMVVDDAVGASPESRFQSVSSGREFLRLRKRGCSSCGGGGNGGGTTTIGPVVADDVIEGDGRNPLRGFLGGGMRIGSSACFVSSYLTPRRLVSSRNGVIRATGLVL